MKPKALLNMLPIVAVVGMVAVWPLYQQLQQAQANRPDYDGSAAPNPSRVTSLQQSRLAQVVSVADGDTLTVEANGQREKIRLCGIDAPEVANGKKPGQPLGVEATEKLRSLVGGIGGEVIVFPVETDRYGRTIAEVFVSAKNPQQPEEEKVVNYELVRAGLAYHYRQYSKSCPNGPDALESGEQKARAQQLGVWAKDNVKPWDFRKAQRAG